MAELISFNRPVMVMKKESTRGTGIAASAFDDADHDIEFFNITIAPDPEFIEKHYAVGNHDRSAAMVGRMKCVVTASVDMRSSGVTDTAPKITKAFQACGLVETVNASTSVTWTPLKSNDLGPSGLPYTIMVYDEVVGSSPDALAWRITSALGNVKIVGDDQRTLRADFEFTGILQTPETLTNANLLTLTSPDTAQPNSTIGSTLTAATISQRMTTYELDAGNQIDIEPYLGNTTGNLASVVTDRKPTFKYNSLCDLIATDPVYTRFLDKTEHVIGLATTNYAIDADKAQLQAPGIGTQDNLKAWDCIVNLNQDTSNGYPWILTHTVS